MQVRADKPFRFAVGSFLEEHDNYIEIVQRVFRYPRIAYITYHSVEILTLSDMLCADCPGLSTLKDILVDHTENEISVSFPIGFVQRVWQEGCRVCYFIPVTRR